MEDVEYEVDRVQVERVVDRAPERGAALGSIAQQDLVEAITNGVLEGVKRFGLTEKHGEVVDAVTNITVDPPDLNPILSAIRHLDMSSKHSEMLEAVMNITVDPPDLTPILNAIAKLNIDAPDLTPITREVRNLNVAGRHSELLQAISRIAVEPTDLAPVHRLVNGLSSTVHDKHKEVLEAIYAVNVQHELSHIDKLVQELRAELRQAREEIAGVSQRGVPAVISDLRQDFDSLRQEIYENRQHARDDAAQLLGEVKQVVQGIRNIKEVDYTAIADAVQGRIMKVDHATVIQHLRAIEPDHQAMASVIIERLKKVSLNVDHSEVLQGLRKIKGVDHQELANAVHDRLSRTALTVNNDDVLKELRKHGQKIPDIEQLMQVMEVDLSPVTDAIAAINIEVDHTPILSEIRKIKVPGHEEIAGHVHDRLKQSHAELLQCHTREILKAVNKLDVQQDLSPIVSAITSAEVDFTSIHEAINSIDLTVDHSPILEAIRQIKVPDHEEIAATVHERLRRSNSFPDHSEVLKEIRKVIGPVLQAINSAEIDLGPVHEAIRKIKVYDHGEVLQAIKRIQVPDHHTIAGAVHDRLAKGPLLAGLPDHGELVKEIRKNRGMGDTSQIMDAINKAEIDLSPVIEAIQRVNVNVDMSPVMQAIANLRAEMFAMRGMVAIPAPVSPRVGVRSVQTALPAQIAQIPTVGVEPKVITREAYLDPLLRSTEYFQMQPSEVLKANVIEERISAPVTYAPMSQAAVIEERISAPVTYSTTSQVAALPNELVATQSSPRFQFGSISYQPAVQAGYTIGDAGGTPGRNGAQYDWADRTDSSPRPRRASSTPLMENVVRGPTRQARPF